MSKCDSGKVQTKMSTEKTHLWYNFRATSGGGNKVSEKNKATQTISDVNNSSPRPQYSRHGQQMGRHLRARRPQDCRGTGSCPPSFERPLKQCMQPPKSSTSIHRKNRDMRQELIESIEDSRSTPTISNKAPYVHEKVRKHIHNSWLPPVSLRWFLLLRLS